MSRYIINAVQFDEDGSYSITYLDKEDALRRRGAVMKSLCVTLSPDSGELYRDLHETLKGVYEVVQDVTEAYRDEAAYVPEEEEPEEDEDKGMGWA